MERKLLLAIALMMGVMFLSNILFPPLELPPGQVPPDSAALAESAAPSDTGPAEPGQEEPADTAAGREAPADTATPTLEPAPVPEIGEAAETEADARPPSQIVTVSSGLYEYRFDTRGARLVSAVLKEYPSFDPGDEEGAPVQLLREGDAYFGARVFAAGTDTVPLGETVFEASATEIEVTEPGTELRFHARLGGSDSPLSYTVTYRFVPDGYRIRAIGGLEGYGERGYTVLLGLGRGLDTHEANQSEDVAQMALVTRTRNGGISTEDLDAVEDGETLAVGGGPLAWAASKSKYFLAAIVSPEDGPGFGGVVMRGVPEDNAASLEVTVPVPAGTDGFEYLAYVGPQDFERLRAVGQELHNVNPFGWRWLQWFIRPFGNVIIAILIWMHEAFTLAYGWVLILFGVLTRILLFPLYQKSMRQQMKQMAVQPEIKAIQEKYKDDPPKLQQEMMAIYKEHGINPIGGCLPMLLPFPILITLFFVFQNTIEFRGVPFLWLPDLSLKDPIYVVPLLMGASMLLLNWIGQRGMETNQQMKIFTYVLPVVFTFMFSQFAAGLNLYYAASNIASLPQQLYLSKERQRARGSMAARTKGGGGKGGKGG